MSALPLLMPFVDAIGHRLLLLIKKEVVLQPLIGIDPVFFLAGSVVQIAADAILTDIADSVDDGDDIGHV